jgi:hypothetical protein
VAGRATELDRLTGWTAAVDVGSVPEPAGPVPTRPRLIASCAAALDRIGDRRDAVNLRRAIETARDYAEEIVERADRLAGLSDDLLEEIEFDFLISEERQLFSIGFSVTDGRLDNSHYDLLASEARLASFMAVATGKVPQEHWFKLGRPLTPAGGARALLSWSASMFEYLMPLLIMRTHLGTLLDETYHAVVRRQIEYGGKRGVPWGISESAYNVTDLEGNYQYRAFGVPGLGLKRGLAEDLVVAPYATVLAAPLEPREVVRNLERLRVGGLAGRYGYYEAIDYTPERQPEGSTNGVVLLTYMAHHQHEPGRARQCDQRRADATAVSCGTACPGCGSPAAGACPTVGASPESAHGDCGSRAVPADGCSVVPPLFDCSDPQSEMSPAFEWFVRRDGDQRRRRV